MAVSGKFEDQDADGVSLLQKSNRSHQFFLSRRFRFRAKVEPGSLRHESGVADGDGVLAKIIGQIVSQVPFLCGPPGTIPIIEKMKEDLCQIP